MVAKETALLANDHFLIIVVSFIDTVCRCIMEIGRLSVRLFSDLALFLLRGSIVPDPNNQQNAE